MNKSLRNTVSMSALALVVAGYASVSFADVPGYTEYDNPTPWTHVASACAPDEGAIGKYAFTSGDFSFKSTAYSDASRLLVSPISVRCNVVDPMDGDVKPAWNSLVIGYMDPDGMGLDTRVIARLYKISRATGTPTTIAIFNSNTSTQNTRGETLVDIKTPFDFHNNEYFVQLDLYRTNQTPLNPVAYSARLVHAEEEKIPK